MTESGSVQSMAAAAYSLQLLSSEESFERRDNVTVTAKCHWHPPSQGIPSLTQVSGLRGWPHEITKHQSLGWQCTSPETSEERASWHQMEKHVLETCFRSKTQPSHKQKVTMLWRTGIEELE